MEISLHAGLILLTSIIIISLDVVILIGSKNLSSRMFALLSFITGIWVLSQAFFIIVSSTFTAEILIRFQYFLGISIAVGFYHFSIIYPYDKKPSTKLIFISLLIIVIYAYLFMFTDILVNGVSYIGGIGRWGWLFGSWHWLFEIMFCGLWSIALYNLFITYRKAHGADRKVFMNMFWALFLGIIPPTTFNILLPVLGYYSLNWFGPICSFIWIVIIAYSIMKYRQMNVKAVVAEVLAIGMTVIFFINIFIQAPLGIWGKIVPLVVFILLAIYLIRGVLREASQREMLSNLNLHLEQKVAEQTAEIRHAYDLEKQARRDLEKLNETKDQFIMITQHHLRTPVTSIKWELESMQGGSYGPLTGDMGQGVKRMGSAISRLTRIVDDFLSITALKVGTPILKIEKSSLLPLVDDVLSELALEIGRRKISVNLDRDHKYWPQLEIDPGKMREVVLIIIENAVRYNKEGGSIHITSTIENNQYVFSVRDSGHGFSAEDKDKIESSLFYRASHTKSSHPTGMGIGLSVARAMTKAHGGRLEITSPGIGNGALVTLRLPIM